MFYNPLDGKPERMQIGARVLDLAQWIEVDADYAADLAEKRRLLREAPTQVLACLPQGLAGSREVLALLESHLPRYFPALTPSVESADETLPPLAQAALQGFGQGGRCFVLRGGFGQDRPSCAASCSPRDSKVNGRSGTGRPQCESVSSAWLSRAPRPTIPA